MNAKHSFIAVTTNFELEPVLDQYLKTYPENEYANYEVAFKAQDTPEVGDYAYIVVFTMKERTRGDLVRLDDFLESFCKVNDKLLISQHGFEQRFASARSLLANANPRSGGTRFFGRLPRKPAES
jgi:hypothetical protein